MDDNDDKKTYKILLGFAAAAIAITGGYLVLNQDRAVTTGDAEKSSAVAFLNDLGIEVENDGNVKIEILPIEESIAIPDLTRSVVFPADFPFEAQQIVSDNIAKSVEILTKNPSSFEDWLNLAIHRKVINDYEGAAEIWEYLNEASPTNSISFTNLGNLYHLYLKDYPKSEENFKRAIKNNPSNILSYRGLYELYTFSYRQNTSAAENLLLQGIDNNPDSIDLIILLAFLYKETGEAERAAGYFNSAIEKAKKLGNDELILTLEKELKSL